jgi:hypothetical protein
MMEKTTKLLSEMMDFCKERQNYSYYELKHYAIKNRPDWVEVLNKKNTRSCIAEYLRSARRKCRKNGIPQPTLMESISKIDLEDRYRGDIKMKGNMMDKEIHSFAVKWLDKFHNADTIDIEITDDLSFADDCKSYGFKMDCGESFIEAFQDKNVFNDSKELEKVIDTINDVQLLGSAIFSKWRYYNHWSGPGESILSERNKAWFVIALERLRSLTEEV